MMLQNIAPDDSLAAPPLLARQRKWQTSLQNASPYHHALRKENTMGAILRNTAKILCTRKSPMGAYGSVRSGSCGFIDHINRGTKASESCSSAWWPIFCTTDGQ
ncbi:uncharacterized protein LOC142818046 [Rhipicephalus microplus]|uniref:uncharacterized protein LOC142818046 n=1 Tax=Rhipicephalus microplus TaxID=6941 RepID=UPI003F6A675D